MTTSKLIHELIHHDELLRSLVELEGILCLSTAAQAQVTTSVDADSHTAENGRNIVGTKNEDQARMSTQMSRDRDQEVQSATTECATKDVGFAQTEGKYKHQAVSTEQKEEG